MAEKNKVKCAIAGIDHDRFDSGHLVALAQSLQDKLAHQKQLRELERRRNGKRRELFDAQDSIDQQREELIGKIEKQLQHSYEAITIFAIRWKVS